jgi:hypothetical protein
MTDSVARYTFIFKLDPLPSSRAYFYCFVTPANSLSIMFDEASDINMNGNLNVFVNVCLYTGEVRAAHSHLHCKVLCNILIQLYRTFLHYAAYYMFVIVRIRSW